MPPPKRPGPRQNLVAKVNNFYQTAKDLLKKSYNLFLNPCLRAVFYGVVCWVLMEANQFGVFMIFPMTIPAIAIPKEAVMWQSEPLICAFVEHHSCSTNCWSPGAS